MRSYLMCLLVLAFVVPAFGQSFQSELNFLLGQSVFSKPVPPENLVVGFAYDPVLLSVAASLHSRQPARNWARWKQVRLPPGRRFTCAGPITALMRSSRRAGQPSFVILPGSFAAAKRGSFVNETVAALDKAFGDPNIIAFPGYLTVEFLRGACDQFPWNSLALADDLYERIGLAFADLLEAGDAGVVGFSGGGVLALRLLADDAGRLSSSRKFNRGGLIVSPILDAEKTFSKLDAQFDRRTLDARLTLTSADWGNVRSILSYIRGGIGRVFARDPKQFYARFFNQFRADLEVARDAVGQSRSGGYRQTFVVDGLGEGQDRPGLDAEFRSVSDLSQSLSKIDRHLLIIFAEDDPVLAYPTSAEPSASTQAFLATAELNPAVAVYDLKFGAHCGLLLDPIFYELIKFGLRKTR